MLASSICRTLRARAERERLVEIRRSRRERPLLRHRALRVPRDVEHLHLRAAGGELPGQLGAGHPGHHHIRDEHLDRPLLALEEQQCLRSVGRFEHAIASLGQPDAGKTADDVLVLDEKHGLGPAHRLRRRRPNGQLDRLLVHPGR